jgi:hypothetical protein
MFTLMLSLAVAVACPLYFHGAPVLLAALFGASLSVLATWFLAHFVGAIYLHHVARIRVGDLVMVTGGPHTGAFGRVTEVGRRGAGTVIVALPATSTSMTFDPSQIQRL